MTQLRIWYVSSLITVSSLASETPVVPEPFPATWLTYHLAHPGPEKALPGDPNAAIHYKGRYHLHYIFNRDGYSYAHISSEDLVHWKWHPTVLTPPKRGHGMFSGTAFLTKEGRPAIIYHGAGTKRNQISVALDDDLNEWSKPIVVEPKHQDGSDPVMRHWDPDCWLQDDTYYSITGGKKSTISTSKDLKTWEFQGRLMHPDFPKDLGIARDEDVSCPNLFRLGDQWMLLCISHGLGVRYYLGDFVDGQFLPHHHARLNWARWDCMAPETLLTPDGRRVMWAWCTPWIHKWQRLERPQDFKELMEGQIQHGIQSLPRELSLSKEGELRIKPLRELEKLRGEPITRENLIVGSDGELSLKGIAGDALELELVVAPPAAEEFGIKLLCDEAGKEGFTISYGKGRKTLSVGYIDPPFDLKEGEDLKLRIFIDKNLIEVFANDRQAAVAWHLYDPKDRHLRLFSKGAALKVMRLTAWPIKSIYNPLITP